MYNLTQNNDLYSKISAILTQHCRDEPAVDANGAVANYNAANAFTDSFKIKEQITGKIGSNVIKKFEIMVTLNYLSSFQRTLEMPLINCEINLDLNWSKQCVRVALSITDTKLYFSGVNLSTQDNAKLLEQLKSGVKRTINWNKYQSKMSTKIKTNI